LELKYWRKLLLFAVLDFLLIWVFVKLTDPDPSVSIGMVLLVPFVIFLNLVVAAFLFNRKRKLAKLFVVNSMISAALMYLLFTHGVSRHQRERYEIWTFPLNDTVFEINYYKPDSTFSLSYETGNGSSTTFIYGKVLPMNMQYELSNSTVRLIIKDSLLFGFRSANDSIKLKHLDL
jgi:hypothetical protein